VRVNSRSISHWLITTVILRKPPKKTSEDQFCHHSEFLTFIRHCQTELNLRQTRSHEKLNRSICKSTTTQHKHRPT